jgi:protein gp37
MAEASEIEWTDATWNPITGCTMVSAGCTNCYAMGLAGTRLKNHASRVGLTRETGGRHVWTGEVRFNEGWLDQPLRWRRPRMIFPCAHGDLFHESVPDKWINSIFAVMALAPQHTFQVLTKRPERMSRYLTRIMEGDNGSEDIADAAVRVTGSPCAAHIEDAQWPLPNVWLGTSIEDQATADARIPQLLATPAAVRFISAEPLLGEVDLESAWHGESALSGECWGDCAWCETGNPPMHNCQKGRQSGAQIDKGRDGLDWVICGGESGPGARPMHPDWARSMRDQCEAAGVAFFMKQMDKKQPIPADLMVREWPNAAR